MGKTGNRLHGALRPLVVHGKTEVAVSPFRNAHPI